MNEQIPATDAIFLIMLIPRVVRNIQNKNIAQQASATASVGRFLILSAPFSPNIAQLAATNTWFGFWLKYGICTTQYIHPAKNANTGAVVFSVQELTPPPDSLKVAPSSPTINAYGTKYKAIISTHGTTAGNPP